MKYRENLTWFLHELSLAEPEQFETGSMEIIGENERGQEGSTEIEVPDLALAAKSRIEELEKLLIASAEREEGMLVAIGQQQEQLKDIYEFRQALTFFRDAYSGFEPSLSVMNRYCDELL